MANTYVHVLLLSKKVSDAKSQINMYKKYAFAFLRQRRAGQFRVFHKEQAAAISSCN